MKKFGRILPALLAALLLMSACGSTAAQETTAAEETTAPTAEAEETPAVPSWEELKYESSMELTYAEQFTVDYYAGGYKKLTIGGTVEYLLVPEGAQAPEGTPEDVMILYQPLDSIYLVATSAMDLFRELDAIGNIRLSGTDESDWYIEEARSAMESGDILFAGKYSAPDYELIVSEGCDLAVESTMIYHTPEVKEELERFGIPVLVERSSYESHPLGRMEWIKLYAALFDKEEQAEEYFSGQLEALEPVLERENTGKTVAFFRITADGAVNVRKPSSYIARAIELAGGIYIPDELEDDDNGLSTVTIQVEAFYSAARDADVIIYDSTIGGDIDSLDQFLALSEALADFKAVKEGNVWCTGKNLFQGTLAVGEFISELSDVLSDEGTESTDSEYLYHLS